MRVVVAGMLAVALVGVLHSSRPDNPEPSSDCEALGAGPIRQPGNTASALALVASGTIVWARRRDLAPYAAAVTFAGLGSVAVHATAHPVAAGLDLLGVVAVIGTAGAVLLRYRPSPRSLMTPIGVLGLGLVLWATSRTGGPLCDPDAWLGGHAVWHVLAAGAALLLARAVPVAGGQ